MKTMHNPKPFFQNDKSKATKSEKALNTGILVLSILLLIISLVTAAVADSRAGTHSDNLLETALFDMNEGRFDQALAKLLQAHADSPMASIQHLIGVCYYNIGDFNQAEFYLVNASKNITDDMTTWSVYSKAAPRHTLYFLGKLCVDREQFDLALDCFSHFLAGFQVDDERHAWIMDQAIEAIQVCRDRPFIQAAVGHESKG